MVKTKNKGGYPQWQCRRCGIVFTTDNKKMYGINIPDDRCTTDLVLFDGLQWHYKINHTTHLCEDTGIGLADFQGLNPKKESYIPIG